MYGEYDVNGDWHDGHDEKCVPVGYSVYNDDGGGGVCSGDGSAPMTVLVIKEKKKFHGIGI